MSQRPCRTVGFTVAVDIADCQKSSGRRLAIRSNHAKAIRDKVSMPVLGVPHNERMPEFYLVLEGPETPREELENAVFEAGFDDSSLTVRDGPCAAIWIWHRAGELTHVVDEAFEAGKQAAGLSVLSRRNGKRPSSRSSPTSR